MAAIKDSANPNPMSLRGSPLNVLRMSLSLLLLSVCFTALPRTAANPKIYNIGGVLSSGDSVALFYQAIEDVNFEPNMLPPGVTLYAATILMNPNPIRTALSVCETLIAAQVYAVIVSHPIKGELSPASVSYTCGFYHIPVIGISSRDSAFSDKNIHVSFLRTVPPYSHQADVWVELLTYFQYRKVIFIHSSDADGNGLLGRFTNIAQNLPDEQEIKVTKTIKLLFYIIHNFYSYLHIQVEKIIEFQPGLSSLLSDLQEAKDVTQSRVYLIYASTEDAEVIFRDAENLNMTEAGFVWLVTEQALDAPNRPDGILGLKLVNASDEASHIQDSVYVLAQALRKMYHSENVTEAPKDCNYTGVQAWDTGKRFISYIKEQSLIYGRTGRVAFDDNGDRLSAEYDVINVQNGMHMPVGEYVNSKVKLKMELRMQGFDPIIWPGNETVKPEGIMIPSNLRVTTLIDKPFVWGRMVGKNEKCHQNEVACPWYNRTADTEVKYCCWGYCIELLEKLASKVNFTYVLHLGEDAQYGSYDRINSSDKKEWTGLVGELVNDKADMIVAPLTINQERSFVVDFSKPFKYQGITILERKQPKTSTLVSFLQPFQDTLWILVMVAVHVVALVLYLLDRFSPFGRFKLANSDATEEDALNLSSAIWFAWGVLLNSGIGEGTPRSFSARVLGMVWAGFAMIIVASYTANLAAFLVLERPETSLSGINDARLRNPVENFTYATVRGSAVDMYFKRQVELSNMYRTMESNNYDTAEEAIIAVKSGKLKAFIWDSSRLEYEAAQDCELVTAGELFGRSGYGIALKKNSPWSDKVTLAILSFHESKFICPVVGGDGYMEDLDKDWIHKGDSEGCQQSEKTPATLGLKNMAGVFILVAAGIVGGVGLIIIEIIYKKHQITRQKRMELARHAADKWRRTIQVG
uniref:Glutamate [NMDA] receptor subunit 1 n=1 Tax=Strigamia maritima TaxID=126957 RepID=T1J761_STRMM